MSTPFTNRKDFGLGSRRQLVPVATVLDYAGSTAPDGYLLCDGSVVRQEDYANLYKVIGAAFNTGGEAGHQFRLPDLRGRVAVGKDNMGGTTASRITAGTSGITGTTLGASGGNQMLQSHGHGVNDPGHSHWLRGINGDYVGASGGGTGGWALGNDFAANNNNIYHLWTDTVGTGISIQSAGAGSSQNVQPSLILNKIIKY